MTTTGVIVLAAGQGTRMKSTLPKVLHPVCGVPMAGHVLAAARALEPARMAVVVGHEAGRVRAALAAPDVVFVEQPEMLGTGDAVRRCEQALAGCEQVLVLNGDCPLVTPGTLTELRQQPERPLRFVTARAKQAGRLGRVEWDEHLVPKAIIEASDYEGPLDAAAEVNAGLYAFKAEWLWRHIGQVPRSAKGEFYLTHLVSAAYSEGAVPAAIEAAEEEVLGVDDRVKLAEAERLMRERILQRHMLAGVTIADPSTTYIDATVQLAQDVTVLPNCSLSGSTRVSTGTVIGPGTILRDAAVAEDCRVLSSVIEESEVGARTRVGPFAHVRGGARIGEDCELGNYAEVKNSVIGRGVKMHHFSYVGDADVGEGANIAAGVITCNYDGVAKHHTHIGERAFVGCDTMLVAPVSVGDGAITGAGAVVKQDIPAGAKAVGVPARIIGQAHPEQ